MWLTSDAFEDGAAIPARFTCDGENLSPPLAWGDLPAGARSLALLCEDPDAPGGTFRHWAAFDIPADVAALPEGASQDGGLTEAVNDFGALGYGGPCPPPADPPHRYVFRLLALSQPRLALPARPSCRAVARAAGAALLGEATLTGLRARGRRARI
jgi:hypothetical protein